MGKKACLAVEAINYIIRTKHQNSVQIKTDRVTSNEQLLAANCVIHRWGNTAAREIRARI